MAVYKLCRQLNICLSFEWVSQGGLLSVGSLKKELHQEVVAVYKLCPQLTSLSLEWVSQVG